MSHVNLATLTVPELKTRLKKKGIGSANKTKKELVELVAATEHLYDNLELCDHAESEKKRRRVQKDNGELVDLPDSDQQISWSKDLSLLPCTCEGDVFAYLLTTCEWPTNRLTKFKEQDGYKMFLDKHVEEVELGSFRDPLCQDFLYVRGKVKPEQRQTGTRYSTWLIIGSSGEIKSAGCQCVAADAGTCKHVVCLLFAIADFNSRRQDKHTEVGTDRLCSWNEPRRASNPVKIVELDYRHDKTAPLKPTPTPVHFKPLKELQPSTVLEVRHKIADLCRAKKPGALLLTAIDPPIKLPEVPTVPELAESFKLQGDQTDFTEFLRVSITAENKSYMENLSQDDPAWHQARLGRITASLAKNVLTLRPSSAGKTIIENVMQTKSVSHSNLDHGNTYEPVARQMYHEESLPHHKHLTVSETGLHILRDLPFIGASPDGIVSCSCHGQRLLEIKCTVKHENLKVEDIPNVDPAYHLQLSDGKLHLKEKSPWFSQIQFQMGVIGIHKCDLVVHTMRGIKAIPVPWCEEHWIKLREKADSVFRKHILPIILK